MGLSKGSRVWQEFDMHICIGRRSCEVAAQYGRLSCLQYLIENGCEWNHYTLLTVTLLTAAANGHLSILQSRKLGWSWDRDRICYVTAEGGHLECLKWMREDGCPWDTRTYYAAQMCGNPDVLKYIINQGCPRGIARSP